MPLGKDGNIPRGRLNFLFFSSQKHFGQFKKRFKALGDNLILDR